MATNTELVQQLYVAYFNRPADVDGLAYYTNLLKDLDADAAAATIKAISADFANATEYKSVFANLTPKEAINTIYHNLFGHEADIAGLNYWSDLYAKGTISLATIVTEVAAGAQGTDAVAYENKVTAAAAFTAEISLSADQQLAYAKGGDAIDAAKNFLNGVTDDATLDAALTDIATAAASVVPSTKTALTAGIDTVAGKTGNDVFNAFSVDQADPTTATNSLNAGDSIDGGAGVDTLNIYVSAAANTAAATNGAILKSIEIVNIINEAGATAAAVDASKLGLAATQIWQIGQEAALTNLAATTTAGFKDITTTTLDVSAAATATSATVALKDQAEGTTLNVDGAKLATVTLSGNTIDSNDNGTVAASTLAVEVGKDVQAFSLKSGTDVTLTLAENAGTTTKHITSLDLSASSADITFAGGVTTILSIKGGAGNDVLTIDGVTAAAVGSTAAKTATIDGGAGDNTITVDTSGTGATIVTGNAGKDIVQIDGRGDGKLTVNLGAGNDSFSSDVEINATDAIDAGTGIDSLLLQLVGSNNIGAFSNFDSFDAKGLDHALDTEILADKNEVQEFTTSGDLATGAQLDNLGAGVGYRVTGTAAGSITLNQKAAGALTVTVDADESGDAADDTSVAASVVANGATTLKAVFDTAFVDEANDTATDNITHLDLTGKAATSVSVVSGGANSANVLVYTDSATTGDSKLTSITVTGSSSLEVDYSTAGSVKKLAAIDASGSTGGLIVDVDTLAAGAAIKLGSGADVLTFDAATTTVSAISSFEKTAAAAVGDDADAAEAAIAVTDILDLTSAVAVAADAEAGDLAGALDTITDGVLTFGGAGPATLAAAILAAHNDALVDGDTLVFQYRTDTYVIVVADTTAVTAALDTVVKLTGVTGVDAFVEDTGTANHFFIV